MKSEIEEEDWGEVDHPFVTDYCNSQTAAVVQGKRDIRR
jgi:hypothetical protein